MMSEVWNKANKGRREGDWIENEMCSLGEPFKVYFLKDKKLYVKLFETLLKNMRQLP